MWRRCSRSSGTRRDDPGAALGFYFEELDCARRRDDALSLGVTLTNLAWCLIALDRFDEARTYASEGLDYSTRYDMKGNLLYVLDHLAAIELLGPSSNDTARCALRAARVIGYVDARRSTMPNLARELPASGEYKRILKALHAHLGDAERESALAAGAAMTQEEAIVEALGSASGAPFPKIYESDHLENGILAKSDRNR